MKILLVDGNSFCYRAFYAIRDLRTSKGQPTNAVFGFISILERLIKETNPQGIAMAFDMKGPTFRHKKFENYKIHRAPMPDDLVSQIPIIKDYVRAMNIPIFELQGYEADDVIATLAKKADKKGWNVFIVTGDKDALQLVNDRVKILNPQKENVIYDATTVMDRFGVTPALMPDIMGLMGDTSDNIPGVPGIGEKTAVKLIAQYGSLDGVLKNASKVPQDKLRENLVTFKDQAILSRELAVIDDAVPIDIKLDDLKRREPDTEKLIALYQALEFRTLLRGLPVQETKNSDDDSLHYHLVTDAKAFAALKTKLERAKEWAFDFETTDVDPLRARPIGVSFSFKEKEATYVAFGQPQDLVFQTKGGSDLTAKQCLSELKPLFEDDSYRKIGQNIKYEALILRGFDIELQGVSFDTMVASYVLNPAKPNHNLDDIAMEHLGIRITSIKELIGTGRTQITMDQVELDKLYRYGCQDSDVTFRLSKILGKKLKEKELNKLFETMEMPLVSVLTDMEAEGVAIDTKLLAEFSKEMEKSLDGLTRKIYKEAGSEFNINSPKQLQEILFEKLSLPVVKKTKTGASTDSDVLLELSEVHPLPKEILKFRELSKLKSTYVDALPSLVNPKTHRVHTSFNQTVTATGRLSSSDPNVQNIPVRTAEGRKIRRAFIAGGKDKLLVSADYSQIELRVLAHLSGDERLIEAFQKGADIHRFTASLIFNVDEKEVTDSMRGSAKTVNFGVLYGMGAFSLAKSLDITNEAAKDFIKAYFDRYPRIKKYLDGTIEKARQDGYVETFFQRRRYIPEILSSDVRVKNFAERTAINAPLQGTASDIIKIAMCQIHEDLKRAKLGSKMILQVHDELLFDVVKKEEKKLIEMITDRMQNAVSFKVPMKVSVKAGPNWLDMEEVA